MNGSCTQPTGSARPLLLLVSSEQFGYHTDTFEYCRYLRNRYRITYVCVDQDLPRQILSGVEVTYCSNPPLGKVELGLLCGAHRALRHERFDVVFLRRTKFSFLLRVCHPRTKMVFDIRTGSIEEDAARRLVENLWLRFNALFFRSITVISPGLATQLHLPRRAHVLPLGADPPPELARRQPGEFRLIYVGTFKNRKLHRTIAGFATFVEGLGTDPCPRFTLAGFGSESERDQLRQAIENHGLGEIVDVRSRVDHRELWRVLADHDVGVAFTPRVSWFEHQPSTKVFEYLASGLACIATNSAANREVVTSRNGVLIDPTPDDFCRGLKVLSDRLASLAPEAVANTVRDFSWEAIVLHNLAPFLDAVQR